MSRLVREAPHFSAYELPLIDSIRMRPRLGRRSDAHPAPPQTGKQKARAAPHLPTPPTCKDASPGARGGDVFMNLGDTVIYSGLKGTFSSGRIHVCAVWIHDKCPDFTKQTPV